MSILIPGSGGPQTAPVRLYDGPADRQPHTSAFEVWK